MGIPTGSMQLYYNNVTEGNAVTLDANGNFTITDTWTPDGDPHPVFAKYLGDGQDNGCQSQTLTRTGIIPPKHNTTVQNFTITPDPPIQGQPYTVTGTVVQTS